MEGWGARTVVSAEVLHHRARSGAAGRVIPRRDCIPGSRSAGQGRIRLAPEHHEPDLMSPIKNITGSGFQIESPLSLPEDEVQLWRIDLEALGGDESRWQRLLSPDESARAARYHFARDRQRFVAARALLRTILASYLATDPGSVHFSYSKKEKPSLGPAHAGSNVRFNVTHSGGIALLAFTRRREIGVDVEQVRHDF